MNMLAEGVALLDGGLHRFRADSPRWPYDLEPLPVTPSVG
jgi:hypothetical protein